MKLLEESRYYMFGLKLAQRGMGGVSMRQWREDLRIRVLEANVH